MNSMTGFGRGEAVSDGVLWRAEISSVNRKQLEIVIHLPREIADLETALRNKLAAKLSRGRVQVSITSDHGSAGDAVLRVDESLARQYAAQVERLSAQLGLTSAASDIIRWPGVFTLEQGERSTEKSQPIIEQAVDAAITQLLAMRQTEGANLKTDMSRRLDALAAMLKTAQDMSPKITTRHRDALRQRLADAGTPLPLDDERLVKEIALFADRCDISEEVTRAESHIQQFHAYMNGAEPAGRALDFLSQELFREFNTMGSKANDAALAQTVVQAKTELEKIREQVQNIE